MYSPHCVQEGYAGGGRRSCRVPCLTRGPCHGLMNDLAWEEDPAEEFEPAECAGTYLAECGSAADRMEHYRSAAVNVRVEHRVEFAWREGQVHHRMVGVFVRSSVMGAW
jgi:hypothetical protein